MRLLIAAALLLASGCAVIDRAEEAGMERAKSPIVVPVLSGTLDPLCLHMPLLFWTKPACL